MGKRNAYKIVFGSPNVRDHLEDVDVNGRLILTYIYICWNIGSQESVLQAEVPVFNSQQGQNCFFNGCIYVGVGADPASVYHRLSTLR